MLTVLLYPNRIRGSHGRSISGQIVLELCSAISKRYDRTVFIWAAKLMQSRLPGRFTLARLPDPFKHATVATIQCTNQ